MHGQDLFSISGMSAILKSKMAAIFHKFSVEIGTICSIISSISSLTCNTCHRNNIPVGIPMHYEGQRCWWCNYYCHMTDAMFNFKMAAISNAICVPFWYLNNTRTWDHWYVHILYELCYIFVIGWKDWERFHFPDIYFSRHIGSKWPPYRT